MQDPIVEASNSGWIAEHREKYLASNGADGHMFDSTAVGGPGLVPTLLLTTIKGAGGVGHTSPTGFEAFQRQFKTGGIVLG